MEKQNCGKIILASASPRRSELLARAGFDFEVVVSDAAEVGHIDPKTLVLRNARAKAEAVAARFPDRIVLGADTIVALGNEAFGKPKDMDEAFGMLKKLNGSTHCVYTGVCVLRKSDSRMYIDAGKSDVVFKKLDDAQIRQYLASVPVLDKAGAYAAQEHGGMIIERIDGDFDNVMGLPMRVVKNLLDNFSR